jgi:hypothetical protein
VPAPRLFHFSEDPSISVFLPHVARTATPQEPLVWAIDEEHAPSYWFPRDCPRACCWTGGDPALKDHPLLLGTADRLHAIEAAWLDRMRACQLFVYEFPAQPFHQQDGNAGYWVAREKVRPLSVQPVSDLLAKHAEAGIELRIVPSLWPLIDAVVESGLRFSIIRKSNTRPRAEVQPRVAVNPAVERLLSRSNHGG